MIVATKAVVAIAAAFFLIVSFGNTAHSQSTPPVKILKILESEASSGRSPNSCGTSTDSRNDTCGEIRKQPAGVGGEEKRIQKELRALGKQGETISRARDQVLKILQAENGCLEWFREADPDPASTFRSVNFALEENGPSYIFAVKEIGQAEIFKHPHVASSWENAGRNATIRLNANGAFFKRTSAVLKQDRKAGPLQPGGLHMLRVATFEGNSMPAQITALLHEFGHIIGRLDEDDDSWNGQSARNTEEVLRHCRSEILSMAKNPRPSRSQGQETASRF
jgi:hypothetical protein